MGKNPSSRSPCHQPSGLRRITLTTPSSFDKQAVDVGDAREAVHDALQVRLWHLHRHADAVVAPCLEIASQAWGILTNMIGSPMIGNNRVSPLRFSSIPVTFVLPGTLGGDAKALPPRWSELEICFRCAINPEVIPAKARHSGTPVPTRRWHRPSNNWEASAPRSPSPTAQTSNSMIFFPACRRSPARGAKPPAISGRSRRTH
jgi:hypothetical protein